MLCADVGNDGTLSANDFGVIFGFHGHSQLITPEHLEKINMDQKHGLSLLQLVLKMLTLLSVNISFLIQKNRIEKQKSKYLPDLPVQPAAL